LPEGPFTYFRGRLVGLETKERSSA
jgi:hypothetical protein